MSDLTVERCSFLDNQAVGGAGGNSSTAGGTGGVSKGGVLHQVDFPEQPGFHPTTTLVNSTMTGNQAIAGVGGSGATLGRGGEACGGGILVDTVSGGQGVLTVSDGLLRNNQAIGGSGIIGAPVWAAASSSAWRPMRTGGTDRPSGER
jgi:hypothetical protein